jgi:hypothetical protein
MNDIVYYDWSPQSMLEVTLSEPDNFLKVRETLTRIGIASRKDKTLYQSCHILHKQGHYYITHFKELFALDGKETSISTSDIDRRNTIACLLEDWGLLTIVSKLDKDQQISLSQIKVVSFMDKPNWNLVSKYSIGKRKI